MTSEKDQKQDLSSRAGAVLSPEQMRQLVNDLRVVFAKDESSNSEYTPEVSGLVRLLAAKSNDTKDQALLKALTLYGLALDAHEKGNRLVIVNSDDELVHDVIGFETSNEFVGSVAG